MLSTRPSTEGTRPLEVQPSLSEFQRSEACAEGQGSGAGGASGVAPAQGGLASMNE